MLRNVIRAAVGLRVVLIAPTSAEDVRRFALVNGARFLAEPVGSSGLDAAVTSGVGQLTELGYDRVLIVHSDLPRANDVSWLADTDGIIIVPDRSGLGTNALSLPTGLDFCFSYGPGSAERHIAEARRLGFDPKVVVDPDELSLDVDEPADIDRAGVVIPTA